MRFHLFRNCVLSSPAHSTSFLPFPSGSRPTQRTKLSSDAEPVCPQQHATLRSGLSPPNFSLSFFFFLHAFSVPQLSESTPPLLSAPRHPCSPFIRIITDTDIFKHHSHTVKASKSLQLSALSFAHSYLLTALHYNTSLSLEHCSQCFAQEL